MPPLPQKKTFFIKRENVFHQNVSKTLGIRFSLDPIEPYSLNFTEKVNTMHSILKA